MFLFLAAEQDNYFKSKNFDNYPKNVNRDLSQLEVWVQSVSIFLAIEHYYISVLTFFYTQKKS